MMTSENVTVDLPASSVVTTIRSFMRNVGCAQPGESHEVPACPEACCLLYAVMFEVFVILIRFAKNLPYVSSVAIFSN